MREWTWLVINASAAMALALPHPLHAQDARFTEQPITVRSGTLDLSGTVTLPVDLTRRVPVAVIVAGSGPTDRNGNGPLVQTDMYLQLAHALASEGIASVRYDKRGIGPTMSKIDHRTLNLDDYVGDVRAFADTMARDRRFSGVILIGHSEGAGLVLQAANRGAPAAGVVMLSGMGRRLAAVLHQQFSLQADAATVTKIDTAFARFIRGDSVTDAPPIAAPVLVPIYRTMLASMAAYDPVAEAARSKVPLLIVQGDMDIQIDEVDAAALHAARADSRLLTIRTANHVFKAADSREPAKQTPLYQNRTLPIVPALAEGVVAWIRALPALR